MPAVLLLTVQRFVINRLAGIDYPPWAEAVSTESCRCRRWSVMV